MVRESSREGATSRQGSTDGSALPPTAGWANAPLVRARRASQAASASTASPQLTHASIHLKKPETPKQSEPASESKPAAEPTSSAVESRPSSPASTSKSQPTKLDPLEIILRSMRETVGSKSCAFVFDGSSLSEETRAYIADMPPLIDPYGGAKRRVVQDKEAEARAKAEAAEKQRLEEQAKFAAEDAMDEEHMATGSLALGGEPEDNPRSTSARGAIGRPPQQTPTGNLPIDQLTNLNLGRSLTPQQRQFAMPNAASMHNAHLPFPSQNTATELSEFDRRGGPQYSQAQYDQISGHARHGSRYFNNESKSNNNRFPTQQQQPYFSSGVQGPPPGLPTAGTPPVSGGGMFAHGQGFTSKGFGATQDSSDASRNRSGTNVGGSDVKRELLLSLQSNSNPLRSPPAQASAPGVLNSLYSQYPPAYQDPSLVKQRKKGKKQRHANTSSSGGGVEHLAADPSILSARIHQGAGQQGLFGQNQGGYNQSQNMAAYGGNFSRW